MDSVAIVSPYRRQGAARLASRSDSALNWYTDMLAHALASAARVEIIAPRGNEHARWRDGDVEVVETYRRGSTLAAFQIGFGALRSGARLVHVQHELFAFGGIASALTLPIVLRALRASGRRVVTTIHGVIPLSSVTREFVRRNGSRLPPALARYAWRGLIRSVCAASDLTIVHAEGHRQSLKNDYRVRTPIEVVPIGSAPLAPASEEERRRGREALGIKPADEVLTFFGYFAGYKGIDELLAAVPRLFAQRPNLHVVLAGDVPERLEPAAELRKRIADLCAAHERLHAVGFVPEEEVRTIFAVTDALILPYTAAISASGPLSIAAGYGVPVLVSRCLAMEKDAPFAFDPTAQGIEDAVQRFFDDERVRSESALFVKRLSERQSWQAVALRHAVLYGSL